MSTIAIFSDVHGNLPALKTVLKDIETRNADQVYCLGDLVDFAPWTNEVIELIKKAKIPCLMGNHDERIAFNQDIVPLNKHSIKETAARTTAINYTKKVITPANRNYLANLPFQLTLTYHLKGKPFNIVLVHASTRSNDEYIYEDHDQNDVQEMMAEQNASLLIMGHTHESYIKKILTSDQQEEMVINCGSAGRSKEGAPLATYLLLTIENEHIKANIIKLEYPVQETVNGIRQSGIPDFYADFLITQPGI